MKRIFIADDSEVLRIRLVEVLSEIEGIEIIGEADTANDAIKAIKNLKPDVVILDIRMPGGNGIEALEAVKMVENPPLVIMFTSYPYLQFRKKCLDAGADYFFFKSTEFEKLTKLLKKIARIN